MVHRLLQAALGYRELDDRDHYGNKRLDLAGPLLALLFRGFVTIAIIACILLEHVAYNRLFKNLTKEVRLFAQKYIDKGRVRKLVLNFKMCDNISNRTSIWSWPLRHV